MNQNDKIPKQILAYIAGFCDGEASITIHRPDKSKPNYILMIGICQINKEPLDLISYYFGGNVYKKYKNKNRKGNMWTWSTSTRKALVFLKAIEPYLIVKKSQAIVAIKFQERISSKLDKEVSEHELAVREAERILIANLKNTDNKIVIIDDKMKQSTNQLELF